MPAFDVVSKFDKHEVTNAVDQANREVSTRFDFKDTKANFKLTENVITLTAPNSFQLQQMQQILEPKLVKRGIAVTGLEWSAISESLHSATQKITIQHGIDHERGKKINKVIKEAKLKIQASLMGDHVRVTGKKKDELQAIMALLKKEEFGVPLQFENFRD